MFSTVKDIVTREYRTMHQTYRRYIAVKRKPDAEDYLIIVPDKVVKINILPVRKTEVDGKNAYAATVIIYFTSFTDDVTFVCQETDEALRLAWFLADKILECNADNSNAATIVMDAEKYRI